MRSLVLALLLAGTALAGWEWSEKEGFIPSEEPAPANPKTPIELAKAGHFSAAAAGFAALAQAAGKDVEARRVAILWQADAHLRAREWDEAYEAYEVFYGLARFHAEQLRARRFQIQACIIGVEDGAKWDWFGLLRGSKWAEKKASEFLITYPFEDFSIEARFRLADALLTNGRPEEAVIELDSIIKDYGGKEVEAAARLRKAEAHHAEYAGADYDGECLANSRREFRRFLDLNPTGPDALRAHVWLDNLSELQAEKDFEIAEHYRGRSRWRSALLYYREVVTRYPGTDWAARAGEAIPKVEAKIARLPKQDREK